MEVNQRRSDFSKQSGISGIARVVLVAIEGSHPIPLFGRHVAQDGERKPLYRAGFLRAICSPKITNSRRINYVD